MKTYENMPAKERHAYWIKYKNACDLCVTFEARTNPVVAAQRNRRADVLYFSLIKYFDAKDILAPIGGAA